MTGDQPYSESSRAMPRSSYRICVGVIGVTGRVPLELEVANEVSEPIERPGVVGGCEKVENGIGVGGGVRRWVSSGGGVVNLGILVVVRGIERGVNIGLDLFEGVEGGGEPIRARAKRGRDVARNGIPEWG